MKNEIAFAAFLITFALVVISVNAPFTITCEAGGPYSKNATINIVGNVTNSSGFAGTVSVNISTGSTVHVNSETTSDDDGNYAVNLLPDLDFDTYTTVTNASSNGTSVYCTDTFTIQIGVNTSCIVDTVNVEGTAVYSSSGKVVNAANVTAAIVEESIVNTSRVNSIGEFNVPLTGCMVVGTRYTVSVIVEDDTGKRSQTEQLFVFS